MRAVLLLLCACACTTTKTAEQHAEVGLETRKVERVETHTEEGEWSVKTWEFAPQGGGDHGESQGRMRVPSVRGGRPDAGGLGQVDGDTGKAASRDPETPGSDEALAPLVRYTEEVHSPTKITSTAGAEQQTTLKAASEAHSSVTRSWWPPAWLLACLALGALLALWALRRKISALKGLL